MSLTAELLPAILGTVAIWLAVVWAVTQPGGGASSSYSKPGKQPVPPLHKPDLLGRLRHMKRINAVSGLLRRHVAQILMRPKHVVPTLPVEKQSIQRRARPAPPTR